MRAYARAEKVRNYSQEVYHVMCVMKTKDNNLHKLKMRYSLRKRLFKCCAHEVGAFLFLVS